MKRTAALIIVTADDFPAGANVAQSCARLIRDAGEGRHEYGGKHYPGHCVVMRKWAVAKSLKAQRALNSLTPALL